MKVLHIEDRFHPGMGYQINFFAKYHDPSYQFSILTSDSSRLWTASEEQEDLTSLDEKFENEFDVTITRLPSAMDRRSKNNIWMKGLTRAIRRIDPDILFVHTIESYSSLRIILNRRILSRYQVFFDTHTLLNQFQIGLKFRLHHWILRNIARRRIHRYGINVFGTVPENQMILHKEYGFSQDQILYSPIGTDLSIFRFDAISRNDLRLKEEIKDNDSVLLYTGKLNSRKNPHLILEAVKLIEQRISQPLYLYFVGAADQEYQEREFRISFSNEKIHMKILPAVSVSTLYQWYSMADFAVFPNENTLSALDAQACRLPVIMETDMTNQERLAHGGVTYGKGNMEDLSKKIMTMINQPEQRSKLANEGESYVRSKYDYRKIVREMESDLGIFGV